MTTCEARLLTLQLDPVLADTIEAAAGRAGMAPAAWLVDQIEIAFGGRALSNREAGRIKRRASRRKRRAIALANRHRRAAEKAARLPDTQTETPSDV